MKNRATRKRGPPPEVLKIEGDWKDAMARMLQVPSPKVAPKKKRKK